MRKLHDTYQHIIFLGISASAHLAILLLLNEQVETAVAFDGILQGSLPQGDNSKLVANGVHRLTTAIWNLSEKKQDEVSPIVVVPKRDNLIPTLQLRSTLRNAQLQRVDTTNHLITTSFGLLQYVASGKLL